MFGKRKKSELPEEPLSEESQWQIINEEALYAASRLIHLQVEIWNSTMVELAEMGVFVSLPEETTAEINRYINQLKAASVIAYDLMDIELPTKAE